jgi:amino-acid N-acetyltransferase
MNNDYRPPPNRLRLTGLQEAQIPALVELDAACSEMYEAQGFDGAEVPRRSAGDFVSLVRGNSVHVVEADHEVAGYLAWHDASPGVAYLSELAVHPRFQRFGVGSKLLQALRDEARSLGLEQVVARCWENATWAMAFYRRHGFSPVDVSAPAKVRGWRDEHCVHAPGQRRARPGEVALWSAIGASPESADAEPGGLASVE